MTLILKQLFSIIKILNSETGEKQIAMGVACGFILGFSPVFSLQALLVIFLLFVFRIQMGMAIVSSFFFGLISYLIDPLAHEIGLLVLNAVALKDFFTTLYHLPIIPFTKFYNTVVMGSGIISLSLSPFIYLLVNKIVIKYRKAILERFQQSKFWKAIKATSLYKWYAKYDELYG